MQLFCPQCGQAIQAADINVREGIAKCSSCAVVFSFFGEIERREAASDPGLGDDAAGKSSDERRSSDVPRPRSIRVLSTRTGLHLSLSWHSPKSIFLLFFVLFWDTGLIVCYSRALTDQDASLGPILFPLGHLALGVWLTYTVLCMFVNRTHIEMTAGRLRVRHAPLPWIGNRDVLLTQIERLYCRSVEYKSRKSTLVTHVVHARLQNGDRLKIVSGLEDLDEALFIEQEISRRIQSTEAA